MKRLIYLLTIINLLIPYSSYADTILPPGYRLEFYKSISPNRISYGMRFDNEGNLFVSHYPDNAVYKISPDGQVSVFASTYAPMGIDFDDSGKMYVGRCIDNNSIGIFTSDGTMVDSIRNVVDFHPNSYPGQLKFDSEGNLFVNVETFGAGGTPDSVLRISAPPGSTKTYWQLDYSSSHNVLDHAIDHDGNVYAADYYDTDLVKINQNSGEMTVIANIPWISGLLFDRTGFFGNAGDLLIYQWGSPSAPQARILKMDMANGYSISTFADNLPVIFNHYGPRLMRFNSAGELLLSLGGDIYKLIKNIAPIADAGLNIAIASLEQPSTIIHGTASDSDGDNLEYRWLEGDQVIIDWSIVGTGGEASLDLSLIGGLSIGEHTLTLEVRDGYEVVSDEMILTVDNSAPNVQASGAGTYELFSAVLLGGSVSDYDGDTLTYQWDDNGAILFSGQITTIAGGAPVSLPQSIISDLSLGIHILVLEVSDGVNEPVCSSIAVEIIDTVQPTLAPVTNISILWPPNHRMVDIEIDAHPADNSGGSIALAAEVSSNEPIDGTGDGDTAPDWTEPIIDQTLGTITLQLRAERSASGEGRVYTITITATDGSGNYSMVDVDISVPHSKGKAK